LEDKDRDGDNAHEQDESKEDVVVVGSEGEREATGGDGLVGIG
jgi:hypothetical protein